MLHHLGSNITPASVQHVSRALGAVQSMCTNFEDASDIPLVTSIYSRLSFEKDLLKPIDELQFSSTKTINRQHESFKKHKP